MEAHGPAQPAMPDWDWKTFPVFFAFAVGVVIMGIVVAAPPLDTWLFILGLLGVSFGVAHIATRAWIAKRRRER